MVAYWYVGFGDMHMDRTRPWHIRSVWMLLLFSLQNWLPPGQPGHASGIFLTWRTKKDNLLKLYKKKFWEQINLSNAASFSKWRTFNYLELMFWKPKIVALFDQCHGYLFLYFTATSPCFSSSLFVFPCSFVISKFLSHSPESKKSLHPLPFWLGYFYGQPLFCFY